MEPIAWFARGGGGGSGPKHYATLRHFQHETPDSPIHASCIYISALFSVSPEKMVLSNEGSGVRSQLE